MAMAMAMAMAMTMAMALAMAKHRCAQTRQAGRASAECAEIRRMSG
ncbi:hypothetical protein [Burkholderia oklahomensis]|nr:hypothetical protein [Burkholderia oklahomensis]